MGKDQGIAARTMQRAKQKIGATHRKGASGETEWFLPSEMRQMHLSQPVPAPEKPSDLPDFDWDRFDEEPPF